MRLLSRPGRRARCLAQGDLEAFVGGPVKGCLHEDGAIGQKPGEDNFLLLVCHGLFAGELLVMHCRRPFWLCRRMESEASIGPYSSMPALDILVSMSPSTPHHAVKTPEEATWASLSLDTCCNCWTVQFSRNLFRFQPSMDSNNTKRLD